MAAFTNWQIRSSPHVDRPADRHEDALGDCGFSDAGKDQSVNSVPTARDRDGRKPEPLYHLKVNGLSVEVEVGIVGPDAPRWSRGDDLSTDPARQRADTDPSRNARYIRRSRRARPPRLGVFWPVNRRNPRSCCRARDCSRCGDALGVVEVERARWVAESSHHTPVRNWPVSQPKSKSSADAEMSPQMR